MGCLLCIEQGQQASLAEKHKDGQQMKALATTSFWHSWRSDKCDSVQSRSDLDYTKQDIPLSIQHRHSPARLRYNMHMYIKAAGLHLLHDSFQGVA